MCDPVSIGIASAVAGAGASLFGSMKAAQAQKQQAQAIADANQATLRAQNEGFTQRIGAATNQAAAQAAATQQTLADRNTAALDMRAAQMQKLKDYQDVINAQNTQAESLRQVGDVASQQLLSQTGGEQLAQAEQARRAQMAQTLNADRQAEGPQETSPEGNQLDPTTRAAYARRTAQAATNIRDYGSKLAQVASYGAAPQEIGLSIADTKYGIMPAATAADLLRTGSATRLLPSQVGYGAATGMGQAQDALISSRGQNALDTAALDYANRTGVANLSQADAEQIAKNQLAQKTANAQAAEAQAGILQGIGRIGLYGGGYALGGGGPAITAGFQNVGKSLGSIFG